MGRQGQVETTALPGFAVHPDPASMLFHQKPGDRKTESCPFAHVLCWVQARVEGLENGFVFFLWYAAPGIDDGDVKSGISQPTEAA